MAVRTSWALRRGAVASVLGGLAVLAFAPAATAQWAPPPWRAVWPSEIEQALEAQGYALTAPLVRRPGIYLADVAAGPGGYQRLIIDARSGRILESFPASGPMRGPVLADRDDGFGGPPRLGAQPGGVYPGAPAAIARTPKSTYGGSASVHIPAAVSPYGPGTPSAGGRPSTKSASTGQRITAAKAATVDPPLPPPAPREAARTDGPGGPETQPTDNAESNKPISGRAAEVDNVAPSAAPEAPAPSGAVNEKPKVNIVPSPLFE